MSKLQAISLYDSKAKTYGNPFFTSTTEAGLRDFAYLVNDSKMAAHNFPADFDLFHVGEFDTDTGIFRIFDKIHLANGVDVKIN